ncbi:hypothetical protein M569_13121 [Genlisea aurea]|uniref:Uncharacterized protein n=1 Tax=Genlisea aurea TaxID=192259 RepID=S8C464_9LAMI|nr:hypothetical protein M569_13121 [Genlisea aurea]
MATGTITEPGVPALSVIDNCFVDLPYDMRYHNVTMQQFGCKTGLDEHTKQYEFLLQRLNPPNCYIFRDALIQFDVVLCKADGKPPDKNRMVAPCADPVGGLIDSMILQ